MRQILKDFMLVIFVFLMFAALPFALSERLADPDVKLALYAPWAALLVVALGVPVLSALAGMDDDSDTATDAAERVAEHHHD